MTSGVYTITHIASGKQYVGSTLDFQKRFVSHRWHLNRGTHRSPQLQAAWNKYGVDGFVFAPVLECTPDERVSREQDFLDSLNPRYNTCKVAGSPLGLKHRGTVLRSCAVCSAAMYVQKHKIHNSKFCSAKCMNIAKRTGTTIACVVCGTERYVKKAVLATAKFCSRKCSITHLAKQDLPERTRKRAATMMGHSISAATRDKIGAANAVRAWEKQQAMLAWVYEFQQEG